MAKPLLTKEMITWHVKKLGVPEDELVVVGGSALQMFDIKRTRDIDAVVTIPQLLHVTEQHARGRHNLGARITHADDVERVGDKVLHVIEEQDEEDNYTYIRIGHLSLMAAPNDELYQATFEELRDEAVDMEGILVSPPERILEWKQAVGRQKDAADVGLIRTHLAQQPAEMS